MKSNKGFAPIAIVLIIIAVLAVGGIAYYAGKSSNPLPQNVVDNNPPQNNQNNVVTPPVQNVQADCLPTTAPWIKVLSPNGGETYTAGQQITVKWKSCNNPYSPKQVSVRLSNSKDYYYYLSGNHFNQAYSPDIGSLTATTPAVGDATSVSGEPQKFVVGNDFKITVIVYPQEMNSIEDTSDNSFTINAKSVASDCLPTTAPWIKVLSPAGGEIYTVGQQVAVKWTSCNVQNVWLGLMSGGKDFGEITYPNPVPASQGSYQWITSNPAKAFTQSNTNSYQIGVESQSPNVLVKSGIFSVKQ